MIYINTDISGQLQLPESYISFLPSSVRGAAYSNNPTLVRIRLISACFQNVSVSRHRTRVAVERFTTTNLLSLHQARRRLLSLMDM
jgi:hypothetical protein